MDSCALQTSRRWVCSAMGILLAASLAEGSLPEDHAPAAVMGDHAHLAREWMVGYHFMQMEMEGMPDGTQEIQPPELLEMGYSLFPLSMTMQMHELELMWGLSNRVTLMGMLPIVPYSMTMGHFHGATPPTHEEQGEGHEHGAPQHEGEEVILHEHLHEASGVSDATVGALLRLIAEERQRLVLFAAMRIPLGKTDVRSEPGEHAPYPMQLGSGTFDLAPRLTYALRSGRVSGGAQMFGILRLGQNAYDYRLGHRGSLTVWGAYRARNWMSLSARLALEAWGDVEGADPHIRATADPSADPARQGGSQMDGALGANVVIPGWVLEGQRLSAEVIFPLRQSLHGPQMKRNWTVVVSWQATFH